MGWDPWEDITDATSNTLGFIEREFRRGVVDPISGAVSSAGESIQSGADMLTGKTAADAAEEAAGVESDWQNRSLDYLIEREELPQQFREQALSGLGGLYGMEGGTGSQQQLIDQAMQSPLYQQLMGGREAGEEAILRSASATGGLRSGNVQANMYDYNTQLQNQALMQSYGQQLQGLQGLAGLPSNTANIANQMSNIGQTQAQGIMGAAGARQGGMQNILGLAGLGLQGYETFSDRRLKKNVRQTGIVKGWPWYEWEWNEVANKMGMTGESCGVLADDVHTKQPEAISLRHGFMMVNYKDIGIFEGN